MRAPCVYLIKARQTTLLVKMEKLKVISFSLWGDTPKYNIGAIENAKIALQIYPGWECWFYTGETTPKATIDELNKFNNVKIIPINELNDWTGMFWRFYSCSDPSVEVMLSRDCDSRLNEREKYAVEEWLDSDKNFHIMRDSWMHQAEIMGGMWGAKYPILKDMKKLISEYTKGDFWQVDQNFLREIIFPLIREDVMAHDECMSWGPNNHKFPDKCPPRSETFFVGQAFNL